MNRDIVMSEIMSDEGVRYTPYKDSLGIWTGGVGHNLQAQQFSEKQIAYWVAHGIPKDLVDGWFEKDIDLAIECAERIFVTFPLLSEERQHVLINMAFVMMYKLIKWSKLRKALTEEDFTQAAAEILNSTFAKQVPHRAWRLANRMERG